MLNDVPEHVERCFEAGMNNHLLKPVKLDTIRELLDSVNISNKPKPSTFITEL